jgi:hypothetical protein
MALSRTTQEVSLEHPYKAPGAFLVVASMILIAIDLGYFETCGNGTGICLDWATHRLGVSALVGFFLVFMIGVVLIVYTGASSTVSTQTTRVPPVNSPAAPATVTVVTAPAPPPPAGTTVTVTPPRQSG